MSYLPIPLAVLYAGLAGTVIALIVATATNNWSLRVFFLLALRLAIGWHFLFEGLYKVNSHLVGPTDANPRTFSSKPYFDVAPGPIGAQMRKTFADPEAEIAAKVKAPKDIPAAEFAKLTVEQQAAECPKAVADLFDALDTEAKATAKAAAEGDQKAATAAESKAVKDATDAEAKSTAAAKTDADKAKAKETADKARAKAKDDADKVRAAAQKRIDGNDAVANDLKTAAKAAYARWVFGVDARPASVKFISGDLNLGGPQRIEHLEWSRRVAKDAEERASFGLGKGTTDQKRVAELRTGVQAAETDLARDANTFIDELRKDLGYKPAADVKPEPSRGQRMDKFTMWFLVVVGAMLMGGLFTRLACVMAAGFLVMTYLAHPAFPWYPLPPNTEGNPVFINKNVIEALALLTLAMYPTGRWLGLDALVLRPFKKYTPDSASAA